MPNWLSDWLHHKPKHPPNILDAVVERINQLRSILMATAQQTLDATTAVLNSFQSVSNSVAAQLAEMATVISDFNDQLKNGKSPDPLVLDTVVQQMGNLKTSQDAMNQQIQDSIATLQAADPGPVVPPPTPLASDKSKK